MREERKEYTAKEWRQERKERVVMGRGGQDKQDQSLF